MEWISVEERLPDDEQAILVYTGKNKPKRWWHTTSTIFRHGKFHVSLKDNVTHWMPIPEPPKEE